MARSASARRMLMSPHGRHADHAGPCRGKSAASGLRGGEARLAGGGRAGPASLKRQAPKPKRPKRARRSKLMGRPKGRPAIPEPLLRASRDRASRGSRRLASSVREGDPGACDCVGARLADRAAFVSSRDIVASPDDRSIERLDKPLHSPILRRFKRSGGAKRPWSRFSEELRRRSRLANALVVRARKRRIGGEAPQLI